ncbi:MAG TPA: hypothetical protein VKV20_04995 [Ktedonobacteraceae bacterium]|jgi:hypothetical protein|nr:hypothetical protein [Ktedonobacteraceae bacterium]
MKQPEQAQARRIYIPAVPIQRATYRKSWGKIPVATMDAPDRICGLAQRVGYSGKSDNDLAIYRLKVRIGQSAPIFTIPGFFVIEEGLFEDYDLWLAKHERQ